MDDKYVQIYGKVFDIQRFSVHDGPGIRTNVFLKGCSLSCEWCCNPESQSFGKQLLFEKKKCIACGACMSACSQAAIDVVAGEYKINQEYCITCQSFACENACYTKALKIMGKLMSVQEVLAVVERDLPFYRVSGGGLTVTGGECTLQPDFLVSLLAEAKARKINTAIETCLATPMKNLQRTLGLVDTYLCDIKHVDAGKLFAQTGADKVQIMQNFNYLIKKTQNVIARIPVIPDFNSTREEIQQIGEEIIKYGCREVELLPYHRLGNPKYEKLFLKQAPQERIPVEKPYMDVLCKDLRDIGLSVSLG